MSEKGRVTRAATHYGDPTDSLLIEVRGEIRELRNRISSLESKVDKLLGSNSEKTANMKSAR
jgi:BMFP domain-containing protein YqiC